MTSYVLPENQEISTARDSEAVAERHVQISTDKGCISGCPCEAECQVNGQSLTRRLEIRNTPSKKLVFTCDEHQSANLLCPLVQLHVAGFYKRFIVSYLYACANGVNFDHKENGSTVTVSEKATQRVLRGSTFPFK